MKTHANWLPIVFSLMLAIMGCGDDGSGGDADGGSDGAGNTNGNGSGDGSDACNEVCTSPCVGDVGGLPADDAQQCVGACDQSGVYDACDSELVSFIRCLEDNGCNTVDAAQNCQREAIDFSECFADGI